MMQLYDGRVTIAMALRQSAQNGRWNARHWPKLMRTDSVQAQHCAV
jgi:hypothetical protein